MLNNARGVAAIGFLALELLVLGLCTADIASLLRLGPMAGVLLAPVLGL